jgi:hypothetical protein
MGRGFDEIGRDKSAVTTIGNNVAILLSYFERFGHPARGSGSRIIQA